LVQSCMFEYLIYSAIGFVGTLLALEIGWHFTACSIHKSIAALFFSIYTSSMPFSRTMTRPRSIFRSFGNGLILLYWKTNVSLVLIRFIFQVHSSYYRLFPFQQRCSCSCAHLIRISLILLLFISINDLGFRSSMPLKLFHPPSSAWGQSNDYIVLLKYL